MVLLPLGSCRRLRGLNPQLAPHYNFPKGAERPHCHFVALLPKGRERRIKNEKLFYNIIKI